MFTLLFRESTNTLLSISLAVKDFLRLYYRMMALGFGLSLRESSSGSGSGSVYTSMIPEQTEHQWGLVHQILAPNECSLTEIFPSVWMRMSICIGVTLGTRQCSANPRPTWEVTGYALAMT